ncbi:hypothetical protein, partial [Streptomyces sp. NPDC059802]|uniref:hypothetical protein n=1 Tax=Streptomyces sp. NPDC059802 TaxID=3346952 RepID=UPI003668E781
MAVPGVGWSWLLDDVSRVILSWDEEPAQAARRLDDVLRRVTPHELIRLESGYRSRRYGLGALGLGALAGDQAPDDATAERHGTAVAALMSFDRSGYLREAGVARLTGTEDPFAIPFLLLRLNDPVEEVRVLAQGAVAARLGPEHVELLVRLLPLIDGLRGRRRAGRVLAAVEDLLHRAGTDALWQGARSNDPLVRGSCLRWLARTDPVAAVGTAFTTRDPALWQWAARTATSSRLTPAEQDARGAGRGGRSP